MPWPVCRRSRPIPNGKSGSRLAVVRQSLSALYCDNSENGTAQGWLTFRPRLSSVPIWPPCSRKQYDWRTSATQPRGARFVGQLGPITSLESVQMRRVSMAILGRYAPAVLQKLLPNGERSKADYGEHAVDGRIQGRLPNRGSRLDESPRFYEGSRILLHAWVSCVSQLAFYALCCELACRGLLVRFRR
jgi:hypothetical protein